MFWGLRVKIFSSLILFVNAKFVPVFWSKSVPISPNKKTIYSNPTLGSPWLVGEDKLPQLEIPEDNPLEVDLVYGGHHLAEELAGGSLAQSPSGPHIRVQVPATGRREHQVETLFPHHHLLATTAAVNNCPRWIPLTSPCLHRAWHIKNIL